MAENANTSSAQQKLERGPWRAMQSRCYNPKDRDYHRYGGRGITVCDRWRFGDGCKNGFECFLMDVGPRITSKHTLDRIDNDGNYEPGNCRWATRREQAFNRTTNIRVMLNGIERTVTEWADILNIKRGLVYQRILRGWSPDDALTTPPAQPKDFLTINGVSKTLFEWSQDSGINKRTIQGRVELGWPADEILQPVGIRTRNSGWKHSDQTKAKMRTARLGKPSKRRGSKVSDESRERMRRAQRARHAT